jgi:hypothetical protein
VRPRRLSGASGRPLNFTVSGARLAAYFDAISTSSLPLRWEAVAACIAVVFLVTQVLYREALSAAAAQTYLVADYVTAEEKRWGWVLPLTQLAYGAAVFLFALYAGGALFTLLVGGLFLSMLFSAAHNLRSVLYYRSFAIPGAADGQVSAPAITLMRHRVHVYVQGCLFCLFAGLFLAHLALLGGALFLGLSALGYRRRLRRAEAHL